MGYDIGISTGWYSIAKSPDLLGMGMKIAYGATAGTPMMQIDLETTSEFLEPMISYRVKRTMSELGLKVGLHAELGDLMALESAERRLWEQSHLRLIETIKHAAELGFLYVNIHASNTIQVFQEERQLKPFGHTYQVVGPDGKPLCEFAKKSATIRNTVKNYIMPHASVDENVKSEKVKELRETAKKDIEDRLKKHLEEFRKQIEEQADKYNLKGEERQRFIQHHLSEEAARRKPALEESWENHIFRITERGSDKEILYEMWEKSKFGRYFIEYGEIGAYLIIAEHMQKTGDSLWTNIAGNMDVEDAYRSNQKGFNAAVSSYYIYNHLTAKYHWANKEHLNGMSILEFLNAKKIYLLIETPEVKGAGMESLARLYDPFHQYELVKKVGSPFFKLCIDFEHMLSQKINIDTVIDKLPGDIGKHVVLFHLTKPIPYGGTIHAQIPLSSRTQETLYRWLYEFRKRGFKDGYLIYERGGGETPAKVMEQTVIVLRLLKEFLEKDVKPDELPERFYGISEFNEGKYAVQRTLVRDHAWDPLKGLILIPEEEHGFLSKAAVEKGKAEEWKRAKFR